MNPIAPRGKWLTKSVRHDSQILYGDLANDFDLQLFTIVIYKSSFPLALLSHSASTQHIQPIETF